MRNFCVCVHLYESQILEENLSHFVAGSDLFFWSCFFYIVHAFLTFSLSSISSLVSSLDNLNIALNAAVLWHLLIYHLKTYKK